MTNLNKSQLQEIPISSGVGLLLHSVQGDLCCGAWRTSSPPPFSLTSLLVGLFFTLFTLSPCRLQLFALFWMSFSLRFSQRAVQCPGMGLLRNHLELGGQELSAHWCLSVTPHHTLGGVRVVEMQCFSGWLWLKRSSRNRASPSSCPASGHLSLGPARGRRAEAGELVHLRQQPGFTGGEHLLIFLAKAALQTVSCHWFNFFFLNKWLNHLSLWFEVNSPLCGQTGGLRKKKNFKSPVQHLMPKDSLGFIRGLRSWRGLSLQLLSLVL